MNNRLRRLLTAIVIIMIVLMPMNIRPKEIFAATESYTITFNLQGHGEPIEAEHLTIGSKVTKPNNPKDSSYLFIGWYKEADCLNDWDFDNDTVSGDTTLYAKWDGRATLTYDINGGEEVVDVGAQTVYESRIGQSMTVINCFETIEQAIGGNGPIWAKTGYTFSCWNTLANGKGVDYKPDSQIKLNQNVTLYAKWKSNSSTDTPTTPDKKTYCVIYTVNNSDAGYISGSDKQYIVKGNNTKQVKAIPNEGYVFVEWNDGLKTPTRVDTNIKDKKTFKAIFQKTTLIVVENDDDDTKLQDIVITYKGQVGSHGTTPGHDTPGNLQPHETGFSTVIAQALSECWIHWLFLLIALIVSIVWGGEYLSLKRRAKK